jgi:hypothetical protein
MRKAIGRASGAKMKTGVWRELANQAWHKRELRSSSEMQPQQTLMCSREWQIAAAEPLLTANVVKRTESSAPLVAPRPIFALRRAIGRRASTLEIWRPPTGREVAGAVSVTTL